MNRFIELHNPHSDIIRSERNYPDRYYTTITYTYFIMKQPKFVYADRSVHVATRKPKMFITNYALKNVLEFVTETHRFESNCCLFRNIMPDVLTVDVRYMDDTDAISAPKLTTKFVMKRNLTDEVLIQEPSLGKNHHGELSIHFQGRFPSYYKLVSRTLLPLSPY
jgi:hypothetical protein